MPPSAAPSRLPLAALLAIVLIGAAMRFWQARESLWLDELHTAWCAMGPLAEVAPRATIGNQSPLYFWLEWLVVQLLGPSELAVRLPSLVAGSLLPIALYLLIGRWTCQPWLGVLAAWLIVVDPIQIFYATEARPYALVELLAVLHVGLLVEMVMRPKLWLRVSLIVVAGLLFHLHYTAALLFPAEMLGVAVLKLAQREPVTYRSRDMALDWLLVALACLPALANLQAIYGRRANWEAFVDRQPIWSILTVLPWTPAALYVAAGTIRVPFRGDGSQRVSAANLAIATLLWLFVPLTLAWLATFTDVARLFFLRYVIVSAPAAVVLAAMYVALAPWRWSQIAIGVTIALIAVGASRIVNQFCQDGSFVALRRGEWRSAIAHFNQQLDHSRYPVLVGTQLIEADALRGSPDAALAAYCLFPVHSLYPIAADPAITVPLLRSNPGHLASDVRDLVRTSDAAWLIVGGSTATADQVERDLVASLRGAGDQRSEVRGQDHQWQTAERRSFGTVHVILLRHLRTANLEP